MGKVPSRAQGHDESVNWFTTHQIQHISQQMLQGGGENGVFGGKWDKIEHPEDEVENRNVVRGESQKWDYFTAFWDTLYNFADKLSCLGHF